MTAQQGTKTETEFRVWMKKVDAAAQKKCGLSIYDLPDYCYRDAFEDGICPSSAAHRAFRAARIEG